MDLRRKINYARKKGDKAEEGRLTREWMKTNLELHRKGLPGVPKATHKALVSAGYSAGAPAFED